MQVRGQGVVISGGASGLGRATAVRFAQAGAKVAVLDRNETLAQEVAKEISGVAIACDVADPKSVEAAFAKAVTELGSVRVAVSCAGVGWAGRIVGKEGPHPFESFVKTVEINLFGTFNMLRIASAHMSKLEPLETGERGLVVQTASVAAYDGQIGQAAYAASKGGVVSLTLPAARELARFGVRVMTIAPGLFATPMMAGLPPEAQASLAASVPFPSRLGDPSEYAALALHIAENPMLNGETIRLDGAIRLAPK
jgi:NAD(P)-dependent dehydrogenase (short-subunit alcohol dehydrogenase family)